jgi:hypothetical protein
MPVKVHYGNQDDVRSRDAIQDAVRKPPHKSPPNPSGEDRPSPRVLFDVFDRAEHSIEKLIAQPRLLRLVKFRPLPPFPAELLRETRLSSFERRSRFNDRFPRRRDFRFTTLIGGEPPLCLLHPYSFELILTLQAGKKRRGESAAIFAR